MTLADLCTSLIEGESVIYSFTDTASRESARATVSQQHITEVAKALKVFTRRELMAASQCSYNATCHWTKINAAKLEVIGHVSINGGAAVIWRFG